MAVRHTGSGTNYLRRTAGPSSTSFSASFWLQLVSDTNAYGNVLVQDGSIAVGVASDGTTLYLGDTASDFLGSALTVGTWYHVVWVRNGNSNTVYLNGVSDITASSSYSDTTWSVFRWTDADPGPPNARIAHLKLWDGVQLSQAEVQQEMRSARPRRFSNLWGWYPFTDSNIKDRSGNVRDWTLTGTLNLEDGPPVPWGAPVLAVLKAAAGQQYQQAIAGGFTSAGALLLQAQLLKAGGLIPVGALLREARIGKLGSLTPSGSLARQTGRALSGSVSTSGTLTAIRTVLKSLSGTLDSAGSLVRETRRAIAGTLATSGTVSAARAVLKEISGTLSSSGALAVRVGKALAGDLTQAGVLARETLKAFAGTLSSSGALAAIRTVLKSLSGSLGVSGTLAVRVGKSLAGAMAPAGDLARRVSVAVAGTLGPAGALARRTGRAVAGALAIAGSLSSELFAIVADWVGLLIARIGRPGVSTAAGITLVQSAAVPAVFGRPAVSAPASVSLGQPCIPDVGLAFSCATDVRFVLYGG